jgi:CDP-diacylglycerol---glycerol-3-phosphate 3-phosphatidyltransferase
LISSRIGHSLDPLIMRVYHFFFRDKRVSPNVLSVVGFLFGLVSLFFIIKGGLLLGGLALLVSGFFDVLDGAVARTYGRVTPYGGFLDSVLDRYTDLGVAFGMLVYFMRQNDMLFTAVTFIAAIGTAIIPYIRARAEAAGLPCKSGFLERPERTILLIIGLCFDLLRPVIILLAILTHLTAIQRIFIVKKAARSLR